MSLALSLLTLGLFSCQSEEAQHDSAAAEPADPLSWSLDEEGPYRVGFRSWTVTYEPPVGDSPRSFVLNVWYPTEAEEGEEVLYLGYLPDEEALGEAAPAPPVYDGGYPVHVHSHGDQGWGATSSDLMRHYASHGWVALAPDHTDNTLLDSVDPRPVAHYQHRPLDIRAALDALEDLPEEDGLSLSDTQSVLMSGHSFGCTTTWMSGGASIDPEVLSETCLELAEEGCTEAETELFLSGGLVDPRVSAMITMAGSIRRSFFGEEGHLTVQGPVLLMSGSEDGDGIPDSWEGLSGIERSWLELEGGCHQTFALGACSTLDVEEGYRLVNAYALAWGRAHILGDEGSDTQQLLDGSLSLSQLARFQVGSD